MDLSNATNLVVVDKNDKVVGTISVLDALRGWREKV
jgi:predicted transcriptional regulator